MWTGPQYDCQQCGACCANHGTYPATGYVNLDRRETKEMKRLGLSVVQSSGQTFLGTRAYAGDEANYICVAFRGQIGAGCGCSIYEFRPHGCRRFTVGSELCLRAREDAGLPV